MSEFTDLTKFDQWNQIDDPFTRTTGAEGEDYEMSRRVPIDKKRVGQFIGKSGQNIRTLALQYGCNFQVDQAVESKITVIVSGTEADVLQGVQGVEDTVRRENKMV